MDYINILKDGMTLYGGNQGCLPEKRLKGYGCGLIAATDVSLLLSTTSNTLKWEQYEKYLRRCQRCFLVLPYLGMNGWALSLGMNYLFLRNNLPYRAHWKMKSLRDDSKEEMQKMIDQGIPVILTAGPNFPNIFGKANVPIYREASPGDLVKTGHIHKHFVVVTAMNENDMIISSWGKKYHMKWDEYLDFARKKSVFFFTNYLKIKKIEKNSIFTFDFLK